MDDLPMDQGWAFIAYSVQNDGWLQFNGVKRASDGYIKQEIERLIKVARDDGRNQNKV